MKKLFWCVLMLVGSAVIILNPVLSLASDSGKWTRKTDMPTARRELSTSVVDGMIYAIGGTTANNVTEWGADFLEVATMEAYDSKTDNWTEKADMPTPRSGLSTSVIDGKIFAIGGMKKENIYKALSTVEMYDPASDTWTKKADMPTPRYSLATSVVDGKIYAIGGFDRASTGLAAVEVYDPVTNSWTVKANMPSKRGMLSSCVVDGLIYAIGGAPDLSWASPEVEAYDPEADSWTRKADLPGIRISMPSNAINGMIYIFGGIVWQKDDGSWISTSEVTVYDPATDTWTKKTDMSAPRYGFSTSAYAGSIYIIGGDDEGYTAFSIVEEYDYSAGE